MNISVTGPQKETKVNVVGAQVMGGNVVSIVTNDPPLIMA